MRVNLVTFAILGVLGIAAPAMAAEPVGGGLAASDAPAGTNGGKPAETPGASTDPNNAQAKAPSAEAGAAASAEEKGKDVAQPTTGSETGATAGGTQGAKPENAPATPDNNPGSTENNDEDKKKETPKADDKGGSDNTGDNLAEGGGGGDASENYQAPPQPQPQPQPQSDSTAAHSSATRAKGSKSSTAIPKPPKTTDTDDDAAASSQTGTPTAAPSETPIRSDKEMSQVPATIFTTPTQVDKPLATSTGHLQLSDTGANNNGTNANASEENASKAKGKSNTGVIAGCVIGAVVLIAAIVGLILYKRRSGARARPSDAEMETREALVPVIPAHSDGSGSSYLAGPGVTYLEPTAIPPAAGVSRTDWRSSIQSMPGNDKARRALHDSIAADAFERAKAQANSKAALDVAASTNRAPEGGARATDAADQAPPYWLTAGEEYGDDKQRQQ